MQQEKIRKIIKELLPEEPDDIAMAIFLMGKERYAGGYKMDPEDRPELSEDERLAAASHILKAQLKSKRAKLLPRYLALIVADSRVDEELNYPSVEELREAAERIG